jgi:aminoglycoside phosphotransferase (APT) family kinase protein
MTASERAMWRSVADTLTDLLLPALPPGFERDTARQLAGLARYALSRPPDASEDRARALAVALGIPEARLSEARLPEARLPEARLPEALAEASRVLVDAVTDPDPRAGEVRALLRRHLAEDVVAAAPLLETFSGHGPTADEPPAVEVPEGAALRAWLEARTGPLDLFDVAVMVGGHSRRMLSVRASAVGRRYDLVVRVEQGGLFATSGEPEARVMRAAAAAGVPVATVRWIEPDAGVLGQPFFVMDRVAGTPVLEPGLLETYVRALHDLHAADAGDALGPKPATPEASVRSLVEHWLEVYRRAAGTPVPLLEEAGAWLRRNLRPTGPVCLVHGDPGPGNFLHQGGRITALTDWEFAHYGDAAEDWTYLALRGRKIRAAAEWRRTFAEIVGVTYDDRTWTLWDAFNQFKGACVNLTALPVFESGVRTTPNLLAIGTAVHLRFLTRLTEILAELR